MDALDTFLQLGPHAGLVVGINFILFFAKRSGVPGKILPWIALLIGSIVYPLFGDPGKVGFAVKNPQAGLVFQGFLLGGFAVCAHQAIKGFLEKKGIDLNSAFDTEVITNPKAAEATADVGHSQANTITVPIVNQEPKETK